MLVHVHLFGVGIREESAIVIFKYFHVVIQKGRSHCPLLNEGKMERAQRHVCVEYYACKRPSFIPKYCMVPKQS